MANKNDYLLKEYQLAQESAQHHDKEAWSRFYIITSIMIIILGFLITRDNTKDNSIPFILKSLFSLFGIYLSLMLIFLHNHYSKIIGIKYGVCKKIEYKLGLIGNHRKCPEGKTKPFVILTLRIFIIIWLVYWMVAALNEFGICSLVL